ncbi:MAG: hypothetical protein FJW14_12030 [Acidimicrobiia bacterium]|nr:hypothetical protein [Acidimicrobiia bacterium]
MRRALAVVSLLAPGLASPRAQDSVPSARLISASRLAMPGDIDSNVPMTWDLVDGQWRLFAFTSWGGVPALSAGTGIDRMERVGSVRVEPHPGWGVWIESVVADDAGTWYGYYHHEIAAEICNTPNRYVVGGVGDLSALFDPGRRDLYIFFSQYGRDPSQQGVGVARLAWADRDAPAGRITVWRDGAWMPASAGDYPAGTSLFPVTRPWHDGQEAADAFWGPSIHWNTSLERYVMLLNRTRDERFSNEGLYVSFAPTLDDPRAWSAPASARASSSPADPSTTSNSGDDEHSQRPTSNPQGVLEVGSWRLGVSRESGS